MSGNANKVRTQLSALRMELGNRLGLRKGDEFAPLWVIDFPLFRMGRRNWKISRNAPSFYFAKTRRCTFIRN